MPRVTAVIPAYNRIPLLRRAIDSALRQSFSDLEVLVVDDGSRDDIAAALADIDDPRLSVIRLPVNRGASAARNTGIERARGEFVAFLDSDDEWLPTKIERQLDCFLAAPPETVMVYTGVRVVPARPPRRDYPRGDLSRAILVRNDIGTTSCAMARRSTLLEIGGFDETLPSCQDWDLYIRLAQLGPIEALREPLLLYYIRPDSITSSSSASTIGHRRLMRKHAAAIASLPADLLGHHYATLAQTFLWKRAWRDAAYCLLRAVRANPRAALQGLDALAVRRWRRWVQG